jgi:hypothetical protein
VRASSWIPHSVAKGPPEWSHETEFPGGTRSSPDRRGVGAYATNGCIVPPVRLEGPTCRREALTTTLPTYGVPPFLCSEFPLVNFEWTRVLPIPGGRRRSKRWEAEAKRELTQAENPATRWKAQG